MTTFNAPQHRPAESHSKPGKGGIAPANAAGEPLPDDLSFDTETRRKFLLSGNAQERALALAYPDCDTGDLTHLATLGDPYERRDVLSHPNTPVHFAIDAYKSANIKHSEIWLFAIRHPDFPEDMLRERVIAVFDALWLREEGLKLMRRRGLDTTEIEAMVRRKETPRETYCNPNSTEPEILEAALDVIKNQPWINNNYVLCELAQHPNASAETTMLIYKEIKDDTSQSDCIIQSPSLNWGHVQEMISMSSDRVHAEFVALGRKDVPRSFLDKKLAAKSAEIRTEAATSPSATDADWQKVVSQAKTKRARVACLEEYRATADEIRQLVEKKSPEVIACAISHHNTPGDILEEYVEYENLEEPDRNQAMWHSNFPHKKLKHYIISKTTAADIRSVALTVAAVRTGMHYGKY